MPGPVTAMLSGLQLLACSPLTPPRKRKWQQELGTRGQNQWGKARVAQDHTVEGDSDAAAAGKPRTESL